MLATSSATVMLGFRPGAKTEPMFRLRTGSFALACVTAGLLLATSTTAWADSPNLLNDADRELLGRLGPDVLGAPIAAIDPAALIEAVTQSRISRFVMIEGPKKGQLVPVSVRSETQIPGAKKPADAPLWAIRAPGVITQYVVAGEEGLRSPMIVLGDGTFASSYLPPEPMLLRGVVAGASKSYEMQVQVHPASNFEKTKYKGRIRTTYTNKGSYRLHTPAGAFDGVVIRTDYQGKLGPATMNDSDIRIYSPKVGLLAIATHDRLHAMLVLNRDKYVILLLAKPPPVRH
ncbi:MAG: hypothetical protein VX614_05570 [Myxococcota bacterium]|nr:hypothetical protein [Myxococcota bacterium]